MQKQKSFQFTPKTVSLLLIATIVLLVIGAAAGSWLMQSALSAQVTDADHAKINADLSQTELQRSKTLETYLDENRAAIEKAKSVVSDTQTYQYQNQIVNDIESYANKSGVTVLSYSFPVDTAAAKSDATGLKSVSATIGFKSPLQYSNYLRFIKYIEQNITKMQITDLTLSPDQNNGNNIEGTSITLKVYVR